VLGPYLDDRKEFMPLRDKVETLYVLPDSAAGEHAAGSSAQAGQRGHRRPSATRRDS